MTINGIYPWDNQKSILPRNRWYMPMIRNQSYKKYMKKYHIFHKQKKTLKNILLKQKNDTQGTVGKYISKTIKIHLKK